MWRVVGLETLTVSLADLDTPDSAIDNEEDMGEPIQNSEHAPICGSHKENEALLSVCFQD